MVAETKKLDSLTFFGGWAALISLLTLMVAGSDKRLIRGASLNSNCGGVRVLAGRCQTAVKKLCQTTAMCVFF